MARPTTSCPAPRSPTSANDFAGGDVERDRSDVAGDQTVDARARVPRRSRGGWTKRLESERPTMSWTSAAGVVSATALGRHPAAVAKHGDPIGDPEDLVEPMA